MKETKQDLIFKRNLLKRAELQLKKEFVGIDHIIEQIIKSVGSWYSFPYFQERPTVINLWGLTRTGKSSVILRLAELLRVLDKFYHFELSQNERGYQTGIRGKLEEMYELHTGQPMILVLDEFQHMRTIDGMGQETNEFTQGIIWQLLDSGRFQFSDFPVDLYNVSEAISLLHRALQMGISVVNGVVKTGVLQFKKLIDDKFQYDEKMFFVSEDVAHSVYSLDKHKYSSPYDVRNDLSKLDGFQSIEYLSEVVKEAMKPKIVDCSKALIFVIGNLDEAYTMNDDFSADIDADEFYKQSLKITVPIIKRSLQERFRSEQIARLGNTHIIYPALNKHSYESFISLQLRKLKDKVKGDYQINLKFNQSVNTLIYDEAVYPTQGTRPIFSTIHQILYPLISNIIAEAIILDGLSKPVQIIVNKTTINALLIDKNKASHKISYKLELSLSELRKPKKDDQQSLVAVHEAGHAVLSIVLMHIIPDKIASISTDPDIKGFTLLNFPDFYPKHLFITHIAMLLGGFAAEEIVFGIDNVTTGSSDDLVRATSLATAYLKRHGFGKNIDMIATPSKATDHFIFDLDGEINNQASEFLKKAKSLAYETLEQNNNLLLKLSEYLSNNPTMNKELLIEYCNTYLNDLNVSDFEQTKKSFYRNTLNNKLSNVGSKLQLVASATQPNVD